MESQMLTRIPFFRRSSIPNLSTFFFSLSSLFLLLLSLIKGIPTLQNLIFVSLLISVLFFVVKRLAFSVTSSATRECESIRWFIGEEDRVSRKERCEKDLGRQGVEFYSNGDCYEGEFYKGKCNGSGVYNFFVKGRYEGDWVDGKYDGYGIESWAKGSRYRGQYKQGMRHGFGVYRFYSGDCYAGEWMNGQSHGIGIQTCFDGSSYVGEFKTGVKHGFGCYRFRNGDRYSGEYFGNMMNGFGVYYFDNGHCYEGSWHEGLRQGLGVYTFRNGDTMSGDWNCGVLKITLPSSDHAIQHAVQAASKAAENARFLPNVEEQVNKVVMAANRAANAARVAAIKAVQNYTNNKFDDDDHPAPLDDLVTVHRDVPYLLSGPSRHRRFPRSHGSFHAFPNINLLSKPRKIRFPTICAFPFASEKPVHSFSPVPFLAVSAVSAGFLFFRSFLKVLPPDFSDRWHQLLAFSEGAETKVTQLPYHLIQAVMASEDRRFFYHLGVDPYGVGRAVVYFPNGGGGSTITQQLVKNVFLTHERKMSRKFVEGILSLILERRLSKWRILYSYLNKMYWGHGKYGIESASLFYFGKHPSLLNVGESALLAGILPAPETFSPFTNPQKGKYSQARVLRRMVAAGFLDLDTALKIVSQPLSLRSDGPVPANVEHEKSNTQISGKSAIKSNWDWEMANASWEMRENMEKWALMKNKNSQ